ncbi:MAG: methyltransferase [Spirochaetales bacterium]|nr:methyltransferase [Spirochaetales bacterium]
MTSRERIQLSLTHKSPDRVPIDLGSNPSAGISAIAHRNLMKYLGREESPTLIYDVVQQLAQPDMDLVDLLGVDILDIGRGFNDKSSDWYPVKLATGDKAFYPSWFKPELNSSGTWEARHRQSGDLIAIMPEGATFFDQTVFPFIDGYPEGRAAMNEVLDEALDRVLWSHLVHSPWDHAGDAGFYNELRKKAIHLRETTDKALMVVVGSNLFEWGTFLRRMDNFLMDLYTDQGNVAILVELLMERHMKSLTAVCESVGDVVDVIRFGDDLGMDSGPFMGLDVYRELFHAHRKRLSDYVHENSSMKTFLHTCGSVYQFIPDFIESGIDIINPVQTNCLNMEPERLKSEFGDDMVFWGGGMDPREILNKGSVQQVRTEVARRLDVLAPRGGFVFANIHNIMPDVPPENIVAMFEAVREFK